MTKIKLPTKLLSVWIKTFEPTSLLRNDFLLSDDMSTNNNIHIDNYEDISMHITYTWSVRKWPTMNVTTTKAKIIFQARLSVSPSLRFRSSSLLVVKYNLIKKFPRLTITGSLTDQLGCRRTHALQQQQSHKMPTTMRRH